MKYRMVYICLLGERRRTAERKHQFSLASQWSRVNAAVVAITNLGPPKDTPPNNTPRRHTPHTVLTQNGHISLCTYFSIREKDSDIAAFGWYGAGIHCFGDSAARTHPNKYISIYLKCLRVGSRPDAALCAMLLLDRLVSVLVVFAPGSVFGWICGWLRRRVLVASAGCQLLSLEH